MNDPINKLSVSFCLPIHKQFENLCLFSVLKLVFELQSLFGIAMMKEFTDDLCSVIMPSLSSTEVYMENQLYHRR